jgi:hypothetical protein
VPGTLDARSFGYAFLGFCFPIVGLILHLVWRESLPLRAKSAGKGALISTIIAVVLYIVFYAILFMAFFGFSHVKVCCYGKRFLVTKILRS